MIITCSTSNTRALVEHPLNNKISAVKRKGNSPNFQKQKGTADNNYSAEMEAGASSQKKHCPNAMCMTVKMCSLEKPHKNTTKTPWGARKGFLESLTISIYRLVSTYQQMKVVVCEVTTKTEFWVNSILILVQRALGISSPGDLRTYQREN